MNNSISVQEIYDFLEKVDKSFPTPLSEKQDLKQLSEKFLSNGTLCSMKEDDNIVSLVAGYTHNIVDNKAYISVVATLPEYGGRGYAKSLIKEFITICKLKNIGAVHLYTASENIGAISMYKGLGFVEWALEDEPRKEDVHLIYRLGGEK